MEEKRYSAAPAILRVDLSTSLEQQVDNIGAALTGGDVESGAAINVSEIHVAPSVQQLLNPFHVPFVRQVHQSNCRVQRLCSRPGGGGGIIALRRQRGLPAQREPSLKLFGFHRKRKEKQREKPNCFAVRSGE